MSKEIEKVLKIINSIESFDDFNSSKKEIENLLSNAEKDYSFQKFKYERSLKDKNVLFSLLNKTSDDLKKANKKLLERAEELDTLLNTIPAMVFFKNKDLEYLMANSAFCSFAEKKIGKIIGKKVSDVIPEYDAYERYTEIEKQVIKNGKPVYNIEEKIKKHGDDLWVSTNLAPVSNSDDEIIGLVGVSWNITEQRNYEYQLQKAKLKAEEGTKIKNQFLANISHEIRTPLNGIIGMSQILTKTMLDSQQKEYLNILINSSDSLLSLVNDILDFSKIEAGKTELENNDFNLKEFFNDITNIIAIKAEEKGLSFELDIAPEVPEFVNGDSYKLKQILLNLAKNAVKFTSKGGIKIEAKLNYQKRGKYNIHINVSDTGIGIKDDKLEGLFDGFYQLDASTTRLYGGTGLGLALSKKLVTLMEGKIEVMSVYGKGSDFSFDINLFKPKEKTLFSDKEKIEAVEPLNVLLAEDNLVNQKITEFSIKQLGYNTTIANNGKEAVEIYRDNIFDFVLMDLQMPVMNGFDATKLIRNIEMEHSDRDRTPVIALTANATKEDRKKSFDSGMDGFMSKPFNPVELKKLLIKLGVV